MQMERSEYMPLAEAAKELGISWHRAWRLVLTGRLDAHKNGGRWLVKIASIESYSKTRAPCIEA